MAQASRSDLITRIWYDGKDRDFLQRFRGGIWLAIGAVLFILVAVMIS